MSTGPKTVHYCQYFSADSLISTVYQKDLEKHITKRCPAIKAKQKMQELPYFKQDINAGSDTDGDDDKDQNEKKKSANLSTISADNLPEDRPYIAPKKKRDISVISQADPRKIANLIAAVENAAQKYLGHISTEILQHESLKETLSDER